MDRLPKKGLNLDEILTEAYKILKRIFLSTKLSEKLRFPQFFRKVKGNPFEMEHEVSYFYISKITSRYNHSDASYECAL